GCRSQLAAFSHDTQSSRISCGTWLCHRSHHDRHCGLLWDAERHTACDGHLFNPRGTRGWHPNRNPDFLHNIRFIAGGAAGEDLWWDALPSLNCPGNRVRPESRSASTKELLPASEMKACRIAQQTVILPAEIDVWVGVQCYVRQVFHFGLLASLLVSGVAAVFRTHD